MDAQEEGWELWENNQNLQEEDYIYDGYGQFAEGFRNAQTVSDIREIIARGGNPKEYLNYYLNTPFYHHCSKGNTDIVKFLLEVYDVNIDQLNGYHSTGLHIVCMAGHVDLFEYLVSRGAKIAQKDSGWCTPLAYAVECGNIDIVSRLLPLMTKEEINITDTSGNNVAHIAARNGNLNILRHLTIEGCDLNFRNRDDKTPIMISRENNHDHIVEYLSDFIQQ